MQTIDGITGMTHFELARQVKDFLDTNTDSFVEVKWVDSIDQGHILHHLIQLYINEGRLPYPMTSDQLFHCTRHVRSMAFRCKK